MANPVTYNSGTNPSGALKSGTMSMSIAPSLDITGYNWRNGFENSNIWVIYSDTYSMGQTTQGNAIPTIWATPVYTDSGLVTLINSLSERAGQTPFTTLSDAVTWLYGQGKYFLSNQNYAPISTQNLIAFWDAGFAGSYPKVGTTVYNLGTTNNGTLTNGPTWTDNFTKSYFNFDGADDYIIASGINLQQNFTLEAWINMTTRTNFGIFGQGITNTSQGLHILYNYGSRGMIYGLYSNDNDYGSNWIGDTGRWYHVLFTYNNSNYDKQFYANGVLQTPSSSVENQYIGSGDFRIGNTYSTGNPSPANGKIAKARIYNKVLSQEEVLQNYYQGPIVTTNLSYLWDASNLVSFQDSSSSITYDLKSGGVNGTLQNGVGYVSTYGGYWQFDGSDDRILLSSSITLGNGNSDWTVNAWIRTTSLANGLTASPILSNTNGGPIYGSFDTAAGYQAYWVYPSDINNWKKFQGNIFVSDGEWHMLTYVNKSNYTMDFYVDGVYDTTVGPTNSGNNNPLDVIGGGLSTFFNGSIAMVQVNQGTAFNQAQVTQQYAATKGRFMSYQSLATGGSETTLSQNGVTYRVHTFTSSGTLSVKKGGDVEVLMVAGGGGGGSAANSFWEAGGGGGAGGLIHSTGFRVDDNTNYTVTIGAGGAGGFNHTSTSPSARSDNGNNTTFSTLTAIGGGGGGGAYYSPNVGGSGGGAEGWINPPAAGTQYQGYGGGDGNKFSSTAGAGGGGGGAGGPGQNGQVPYPYKGGDGGIGLPFTFSGNTAVYYAGGGGGKTAVAGAGIGGVGGAGGGGNGGIAGGEALGDSGAPNSGGGGGGGLSTSTRTGSGGSGVVMIRYIIN